MAAHEGEELEMVNNPGQPSQPTNYMLTENDYYEVGPSGVGSLPHTLNDITTLSLNFRDRARPHRHNIT